MFIVVQFSYYVVPEISVPPPRMVFWFAPSHLPEFPVLLHSGALLAQRAEEQSPTPIEIGETDKNHAYKL